MSDDRQSLDQMLQDGLPPAPAIGERVLWDDEVRGLGLRLRQGMSPTWIYRQRVEGRLVKRTLARAEAMSLDEARAAGAALGNTETTGQVEVSLNQFAATFMRDCAARWKPATVDNHHRDLRRLILPTLGDIAVDKFGKADVTIWLDQLDISGRTKDRATSVLSSMMRHAETLGLRPAGSNPCAGRRRHRSTFSARYLAVRDLRRLALALDQATKADSVQVACIRFLLLTGARRGEALALEWPMIEGDRAILPDSKTGPKCLWLATPVRRLLAELVRIEGSPLVFARPCGRGLGSSIERVWHGGARACGAGRPPAS